MRSAIVRLPEHRAHREGRQDVRPAIRQLERAEAYINAVDCMDLGDVEVTRITACLRSDLRSLRRYLVEKPADFSS